MGINKTSLLPDILLGNLLSIYLKISAFEKDEYLAQVTGKSLSGKYFEDMEKSNVFSNMFSLTKNTDSYTISVNSLQYKDLEKFIKNYQLLYSHKELSGQAIYSKPEVYANKIIDQINNPNFITENGKNNITIFKNETPNYCHSLMYLCFQKKIRIRKIIFWNNTIEVCLDNRTEPAKNLTNRKLTKKIAKQLVREIIKKHKKAKLMKSFLEELTDLQPHLRKSVQNRIDSTLNKKKPINIKSLKLKTNKLLATAGLYIKTIKGKTTESTQFQLQKLTLDE
ncbi:MAG TPA: hypothetical protein VG895_02105 [Patescibacteria group bacterium]|nr:hypothetical protein [Patescibacteria group bacterium]